VDISVQNHEKTTQQMIHWLTDCQVTYVQV